MAETTASKKSKINLSDYPYQKDIENRVLLSSFSALEKAVMEEILFSSIQISIQKFSKSLNETESILLPILEKFEKTGLVKIDNGTIWVDKEMRKYFESQFARFEEDFKPDVEFLQALLRKVPIEFLPSWYAISRTSNNIFSSIIEKYLITPQVFQRHLLDLDLPDPVLIGIAQDVFKSDTLQVDADYLREKYGLSKEKFHQSMLYLEFSFSCFVSYEKTGNLWKEIVTPFHEWKEYLLFLKNTALPHSLEKSKVKIYRDGPHAFVKDITAVLNTLLKGPVQMSEEGFKILISNCKDLEENFEYLEKILKKLTLLKLATIKENYISFLPSAQEWLSLREESKSIFLYRHPLNKVSSIELPSYLLQEKAIRETEKSILRVLYSGWILFDDFLKGVISPLKEQNIISLQKTGRTWGYKIPQYTEEEVRFIKTIIFDWLFETGITSIGTFEEKECFCVTSFGQSLFG